MIGIASSSKHKEKCFTGVIEENEMLLVILIFLSFAKLNHINTTYTVHTRIPQTRLI